MKKLFLIFFSLAASLFLSTAKAQTVTAAAFGDSITQGYQRTQQGGQPYACGSPNLGSRGSSCGYANELTSLINNAGRGAAIYNWGWQGEAVTFDNVSNVNSSYNFSNGVARFRNMIDRVRNDVSYVLIMEGTNDLPRSVSSQQIRDGLNAMIVYSKNRNVTPIIATLPPRTDARRNDAKLLQVNNYIRGLASTHNIKLAEVYSALGGLSGFDSYDSGDKLHVSNAGYQRMAQAWFNALGIYGDGTVNNSGGIIPTFALPLLLED